VVVVVVFGAHRLEATAWLEDQAVAALWAELHQQQQQAAQQIKERQAVQPVMVLLVQMAGAVQQVYLTKQAAAAVRVKQDKLYLRTTLAEVLMVATD
jgi:hypothetical protein